MDTFKKITLTMLTLTLIFTGSGLLGAAGRMLRAGKISGRTMALGIIVFILIIAALLVTAVSFMIQSHALQLKKPKAGEILSDIIRIGELEKQREAQKLQAETSTQQQ